MAELKIVKTKKYTLELTPEEVVALKCLTGKSGGNGEISNKLRRIYYSLPNINIQEIPVKADDYGIYFNADSNTMFAKLIEELAKKD